MQKLLISLLAVLALSLSLPVGVQAQAAITTTTITEPIDTTRPTTITVNSATGISAGIWLLIDNELVRVGSQYSSGTQIPILRGRFPTTHNDNSVVWVVPQAALRTRPPNGSCTRGSGDATYTHTFIDSADYVGLIATCRLSVNVTGNTDWVITSASGAGGVQSDDPPATQ